MKLYVGTYGKYAEGSIAGAWLDLDKYANADEFRAACLRLHKDEEDPELMFQDVETDPGEDWQEGLYSECAIPVDYWRLKAEAEEAKAKERETPKSGRAAAEKAEQDRLFSIVMDASGFGKSMEDFMRKSYYFVELSDGAVLEIRKPSIETQFCCGEDDRGQGGEEYGTMAYAHKYLADKRTEEGFKGYNLGEFDRNWIDLVGRRKQGTLVSEAYLRPAYHGQTDGRVLAIEYWTRWEKQDGCVLRPNARHITEEDIKRIRHGYAVVRKQFKKRLNAYWKRFGASKIRTWTYWTEA